MVEKQFADRPGEVALSRVFHDQLASRFLQLFMNTLSTKVQGAYLPDRFIVESLKYIIISVTLVVTWRDLQPNGACSSLCICISSTVHCLSILGACCGLVHNFEQTFSSPHWLLVSVVKLFEQAFSSRH